MPICFHPTTAMLVDDDADFIKFVSLNLTNELPVLSFTNPDAAISYMESPNKHSIFRDRWSGDFSSVRNEIYNENRFKEIMTSVIDYEMPNKNGFDLMKTMGLPSGMAFHSYILLTGKPASEFDEKLAELDEAKSFISKSDPNYLNKLLKRIKDKSASIAQWCSYDIARSLSLDPSEKTNFLFDGNFLPILNKYIDEQDICEMYLFDKQGSFLFLDKNANPSWLFVRNELGVKNTIQLATQHQAPQRIVEDLKSKKVILSLYEKEDFKRRKSIDWDDYLLPATVFSGDDAYMKFFHLEPHSNYYYAFTNQFPDNGIEQGKIVSYRAFISEINR